MIIVDMKTVTIASVLINTVCLVVLLVLWNQNRSRYNGLIFWVTDWILQVGSALLIVLRGNIPNWASMVLSNSMVVGGTIILYYGLCRFVGKKNPRFLTYGIFLVFAVFVFVHSYFTVANNNLLIRNYNISIGIALSCLLCMWLMLRGVNPEVRLISRGTGIAFAIIIVISLTRIFGLSVLPHTSNDYFQSGLFDTLLVLIFSGSIMFLTFNLVLLVNRRLYIETKQMEELVILSERELQATFKATSVGFAILINRVIKEVNNAGCQMLGYDRQEIIGENTRIFYETEEEYAKSGKLYLEVAQFGTATAEVLLKRKDNKIFPVIMNVSAFDKNDLSMGVVLTIIDITERKKSEARALEIESLKQADKAKNELLTNVSHELRTPLSAIKGFIETLMQPDVHWSREQQMEFLTKANQESDHLTLLIRNLLDMSRIESDKINIARNYYQIDEIMTLADARLKALTTNHKLIVGIPAGIPRLYVDKIRIAQVLTNLVENAVKFSPAGSPILIQARVENKMVVICIKDEGIGISPENMGKLFNRFFQVESAVSGNSNGTGLGLAICKGIMDAHEGKIWVESEVGKGSKFSFGIPATTHEEEQNA
jgi:PAS domain S-box-containing protein